MKKTAILCCKIFDLLYGWNALKGQKPWAKGFCPFYYICTWKNKEVKIFISANYC